MQTIHVNNTKEQVTSEEKSKMFKKKSNNKKQTKKKEDTKTVPKDNSTSNSYQNDDSIKNRTEDPTGGEYIIADSATRLLTTSDIQGLTARELNYAKNEIYARHGRKFDSQELRNYFESKSWYVEKYDGSVFDTNYSDQLLSNIEKKNAGIFKRCREQSAKWRISIRSVNKGKKYEEDEKSNIFIRYIVYIMWMYTESTCKNYQ